MKQAFQADVVNEIVKYMPLYQQHIADLKESGYKIISYARKSVTEESDEQRVKILQNMVSRLRERPLVDAVFVFPCCSASGLISPRDMVSKSQLLKKLEDITDNAQVLVLQKEMCTWWSLTSLV
ncbi:hypothetical protein RMCBS344292_11316 [Rhizopus microsporus]|nr:hypothetical protein RMCBS344292_11316 [Rhizopus microsporus]